MTQDDITNLEIAVRNWLVAASGLDLDNVFPSHQNAPDAQGQYITFELFTESKTAGILPYRGKDADGNPCDMFHWEIGCSVEGWRTGANALLTATKARAFLPTNYTILEQANCGAVVGNVQYLPNLNSKQWEDHAVLPITLHTASLTSDTAAIETYGEFNRVGITATINEYETQTIIEGE
jgi:hypothetical protein